jgi:ribosomal protein L3 glutamine methyltransferase
MDEAAYLVLHALGLPPAAPPRVLQRRLAPQALARIEALIARRIRERQPAAYLTGEAWLDGVAFHADPRAIVPRSFIAELLRTRLEPWLHRPVRRVLDLCTGSGCLAVLAARAFPNARIDASDLSPEALQLARRNVVRHRLLRRVRLVRSDLFGALRRRRYDLIVCNPPYVRSAIMRTLPEEYRHEPRLALAGGADGLDFVRRILRQAPAHLHPGGLLVCEVGSNRAALERAFPALALFWPETSAGPDRVFLAEREQLTRTALSPKMRARRAANA